MRDVAVVIPYFQRTVGVLRRSIDSVAAQTGVDPARIVVHVVDDCSPIPAGPEIEGMHTGLDIRLAKQATNAGPGASRNTGLGALDRDVEYVAFLDSDDIWMPDHLAMALQGLQAGTFFFSNLFQLRASLPAFERAGRIPPEEHELIFGDCYRYCGSMLDQIYTGNVIGTPTVVYRFKRHPTLRFDPRYRRAGEDYLMWSQFAADGAEFVFRTTPSVRCGEGVNVYAGVEWGSSEFLQRTDNEIAYLRQALVSFAISAETRRNVKSRVAKLRSEYWRTVLRLFVANTRRVIPFGR